MMKQHYQTPILSKEVEGKIEDAIQSFVKRTLWKKWGMDRIREQGAAILLHGAPGLGKTMTAYYIGKKLHLGVTEIGWADYGSDEPGELARAIKKLFASEKNLAKIEKRNEPIIFLDECDAMLVSRKKLGGDMIWMLEPITALLTEIARWPGLVILASNLVEVLDEALERRLIAKIRFEKPDKELRHAIWKAKWPKQFPVQPDDEDLWELAEFDLTGAQIENCFILWVGRCMKSNSNSINIEGLVKFIKQNWSSYYQL